VFGLGGRLTDRKGPIAALKSIFVLLDALARTCWSGCLDVREGFAPPRSRQQPCRCTLTSTLFNSFAIQYRTSS
jgi:hypothetical protein